MLTSLEAVLAKDVIISQMWKQIMIEICFRILIACNPHKLHIIVHQMTNKKQQTEDLKV